MSLIYNGNPISKDLAKLEKHNFLNFNKRICEYCDEVFEIKNRGLYYWCGCKYGKN